jgi:hypothetical protein
MKPQFGHLYERQKIRHLLHRHIIKSPQFGHANFVLFSFGVITLLQEVQMGIVIFLWALNNQFLH